MAEADRDRLQLIKEKEALLQELQLISQQRRSPEYIARLEEEKRRLEDEIQQARASSAQGATERFGDLTNYFLIYHRMQLHRFQVKSWCSLPALYEIKAVQWLFVHFAYKRDWGPSQHFLTMPLFRSNLLKAFL